MRELAHSLKRRTRAPARIIDADLPAHGTLRYPVREQRKRLFVIGHRLAAWVRPGCGQLLAHKQRSGYESVRALANLLTSS